MELGNSTPLEIWFALVLTIFHNFVPPITTQPPQNYRINSHNLPKIQDLLTITLHHKSQVVTVMY